MSKVFSIDVEISATAYIRAATPEEALKKARALAGVIEVKAAEGLQQVEISGVPFDDPTLPEVSLSPAMTVRGIDPEADLDDLDVTHDGDEVYEEELFALCALDVKDGDRIDLQGLEGVTLERYPAAASDLYEIVHAVRVDEGTVRLDFEGVPSLDVPASATVKVRKGPGEGPTAGERCDDF